MARAVLMEHKGTWIMERSQPELFPTFVGRDTDVWIASFPRSGTTLTNELTYLIRTQNFEEARKVPLAARVPFADVNYEDQQLYQGIKGQVDAPSPRFFQTHFHHFLLPDDLVKGGKGKVIYVARNPKAVAVSLYKFMKYIMAEWAENLDEFVELFLRDKVLASPWCKHVKQYWEHRHDPNILFLRYEDITTDKQSAIRQIASFLDCHLEESVVEQIVSHTDIATMRNNEMVNFSVQEQSMKNIVDKSDGAFINQGGTTWKDILTKEQQARIDKMVLEGLGPELGNTFI